MKKVLFFAAVAIFGLNAGQAQEEGIRFGVKAGLNISNFAIEEEEEEEEDEVNARTSFHLGVVVEIPLSEKFAFQPELVYSSQGAKTEFSESFESGLTGVVTSKSESVVKFSYLNIPLMAKYYVAEGLSLQAGPQIGFLLSSKFDTENSVTQNGQTVSESTDGDVEDINAIDFGLNFGAGYQLEMGLFFQARYNLGLSNTYDGEGSDNNKAKNRVISLSVGYKF